jgi:multiple sugar transport system permease protein
MKYSGIVQSRATLRDRIFSDKNLPYILLFPTLFLLVSITIYPIFRAFYLSLNKWLLGGPPPEFVGFANYVRMFTKEMNFWGALSHTFFYAIGTVAVSMVLGLSIALLFGEDFKGKRIARALILFPMMIAPIVIGFIFLIIFNTDYGVLNFIFQSLGIIKEKVVWLGNPDIALLSVMATEVWQSTPFVILVVLAGIQALPESPYESALMDGATRWQMFRFITLPLLREVLVIALTIRLILAMRVFDKIYILTEGGPAGETEVLSLLAYRIGLVQFRIGRANSVSVILVILTLLLVGVTNFIVRKKK